MKIDTLDILIKEKNGYVTTRDLESIGLTKIDIANLIKQDRLVRIKKGLFLDSNYKLDNYYVIQSSFKDVIFSYRSALYLLGYLDENPVIEITSPREMSKKKIQNFILHRVKPEIFNIGIKELESSEGHIVKLYNIERTICDIVKNGNWFETIEFEKVLIKYFKSKTKDVSKLLEYAKILNVYKSVSFIIEIMNGD